VKFFLFIIILSINSFGLDYYFNEVSFSEDKLQKIINKDSSSINLYFESGNYIFLSPLYINNKNEISINGNGASFIFKNYKNFIVLKRCSYIMIENIKLKSFNSNSLILRNNHGLTISNCIQINIKNISIENFSGHGLRIINSKNIILTKIFVENNLKFGIAIEGNSYNIILNNITCIDNGLFNIKENKRFSNISISDFSKNIILKNIISTNAGRDGLAIGLNPKTENESAINIIVENLLSKYNLDHGLEIFSAKNTYIRDIIVSNNHKMGLAYYDDLEGSMSENSFVKDIITHDNYFYDLYFQGCRNIFITTKSKNIKAYLINGTNIRNKVYNIKINGSDINTKNNIPKSILIK